MALGYTCTCALCHLRVSSCLAISAPTEDICKEGKGRGVTTSLSPSVRGPYLVPAPEVSIQCLDLFLQGLSCTMPPLHTSSPHTHITDVCTYHAQCVDTYLNFTVLSSNHFIKSSPNREHREEKGGSCCHTMCCIYT